MRIRILLLLILLFTAGLLSAQELYLSGLNEMSYIYRTAQDSLNSYFRDAFSFSLGYKDFSLGIKFLAELPKYSNDQNQLLDELNPNRLSTQWTERWLEFERDNLILHGGTITESFGSGMVFRAWEDIEFDSDTRLDGFLIKYNRTAKLKAFYGALPNRNQPAKNDLVYGADGAYPLMQNIDLGASILTMRTLNALGVYNQQDVYAGRMNLTLDLADGGVEFAKTSLFNNSSANYTGTAINAYANLYLNPSILKFLTLGAGYKFYDNFQYRNQDLKTFTYHDETLSDSQITGVDEEGLQGSVAIGLTDVLTLNANYAEAWNSSFHKRLSDLYTSLEWLYGDKILLAEYGHTEKLDKAIDRWQQNIIPALSLSMPLGNYSFAAKAEYEYVEKDNQGDVDWHYEPMLQFDLGLRKLSVSVSAQSHWQTSADILDGRYWANCEVKYALFSHTGITLFAGQEAGGKVCRNGICRFVAPFQGVKLEATTRF
ncbi:MAG: DUF6029 family protein [Candidatus Cloacimonadaceae bacterium]